MIDTARRPGPERETTVTTIGTTLILTAAAAITWLATAIPVAVTLGRAIRHAEITR